MQQAKKRRTQEERTAETKAKILNATLDVMPENARDRDEIETRFDKAAITSAEKAADIILTGAAKGKRRVIVGRDAHAVSLIQRIFPQSYARKLRRLLPQDAV